MTHNTSLLVMLHMKIKLKPKGKTNETQKLMPTKLASL